ncbi:unnamed protein product, partial [Didymodactylos carnosus]
MPQQFPSLRQQPPSMPQQFPSLRQQPSSPPQCQSNFHQQLWSNINSIRAPTSDVTSIINETCYLPYNLTIGNDTVDMYFCYDNQCTTQSGYTGTCEMGSFGVVSIETNETSKVINTKVQRPTTRDDNDNQCLQYYYYFTNENDYGQNILVVAIDDETMNNVTIDEVIFTEMKNNSWHSRNKTFNLRTTNYTIYFYFTVSNENKTEVIYFAIDEL